MFEVGDKVEVVHYGSIAWTSEHEWKKYNTGKEYPDNCIAVYNWTKWRVFKYDTRPDLIGKVGFISTKKVIQGRATYALEDIKGSITSWYDEEQLKLIEHGIKSREVHLNRVR